MQKTPENRIVISNTTPLMYLHKIGHLNLLQRLYGKILVTRQVVEELDEGKSAGAPDLQSQPWIEVRNVRLPEALRLVPDLGGGEASAIALALEFGRNSLVILDDSLGRRIAALQDISITGTAGVLLRARKEGLILEVRSIIDALVDAGFYLRPQHRKDILRMAGE